MESNTWNWSTLRTTLNRVVGALALSTLMGCVAPVNVAQPDELPDSASLPASLPAEASSEVRAESERLVAQDMVNVLVQIDSMPVHSTTLHFPKSAHSKDDFARQLHEELVQAGYAIRMSDNSAFPTDTPVTHTVETAQIDAYKTMTYTVSVGDVGVRRAYQITEQGGITPYSSMQIKGVDASQIRIDQGIFASAPREVITREAASQEAAQTLASTHQQQPAVPASSNAGTGISATTPQIASNDRQPVQTSPPDTLLTGLATRQSADRELLDIVAPVVTHSATQTNVFGSIAELSAAPTRNVRELGESNFASVFDELAIVKETILTFDNDSIRLGANNKARISQFIDFFEPSTDIFSIIGCSTGPTRLEIGQQGLALGRANTVKQELMFSGIPDENILEEGCWAEEAYDHRMPRRGVVVALKRRLSS